MIAILVPSYKRANRLYQIYENLIQTTVSSFELYFIVEVDDTPSLDAITAHGFNHFVNERSKSYSGAINHAYKNVSERYLFAGADDLRFHQGWDRYLIELVKNFAVVASNDLFFPEANGLSSTHYLVSRDYIDSVGGVVDQGPGSFLNEEYRHNYCDTEFVGTAKSRGVFSHCPKSVVEHMHWGNGKAEMDETYQRNHSTLSLDRATFTSREHLWQS